jgi:transposase InsO family protein
MIYDNSKRTYGSPRIALALKGQGIQVSRNRVARVMKKEGLRSIIGKKFVVTTDSRHNYPVVENLLDRNFKVNGTGKVWVSDITYVRTSQGWLYLTVIIDLGDRKVIGWSLSSSLKTINTTVPAWIMAVRNRPITQELIFHSDRGIQYACNEFKNLLAGYRWVRRSMSRKGDCWDNAVAESFFKNLKVECVYQNRYRTRKEAAISIFEYIETWYNTGRIHSTLQMTVKDFTERNSNQKLVA